MVAQDKAVRDRLRRAEGQIGGVIRMLAAERPCEEVVTQLLAVRSAIDRAAGEIIMAHIDDCMVRLPPEQVRDTVGRAIKMMAKVG